MITAQELKAKQIEDYEDKYKFFESELMEFLKEFPYSKEFVYAVRKEELGFFVYMLKLCDFNVWYCDTNKPQEYINVTISW